MSQVCNIGNGNAYKPDAKSRHPLYHRWKNMVSRCADVTNKNYGGRGITVCKRWLKFENFVADMFEGFDSKLTLDRINNDKGYFKSNCRWTDAKVQAKNTRRSYDVPEEIEHILIRRGISFAEYGRRIKSGMTHLDAIKRHKNL